MNPLRKTVILHLLRYGKNNEVGLDLIKKKIKITGDLLAIIIDDLHKDGLIQVNNDVLSFSLSQRIGLARVALEEGVDFESVSRNLNWLEFEEFSALLFEENGFRVFKRFRFTGESRRWEIDILAIRKPYIICAECKHWKKGIGNTIARGIIENHIEKVKVFNNLLEKFVQRLNIFDWDKVIVIPIAITLSATPMTIYRIVPCISILSLPFFLNEFDGQLEGITSYKNQVHTQKIKPRQMKLRKKN